MKGKINILRQEEEKMLVGILYNHLTFGTTMEVFGELTKEGVVRLDGLRNIFSKLIRKFSLVENIDENTFLILGLVNFIHKSTLEKFAQNDKNKHLQNRAKYFLKKK